MPFADVLNGRAPNFGMPMIFATAAVLVGFLPCLLLCIPAVLFSFWVRRRFGLKAAVWYALLGSLTGSWVGVLFAIGLSLGSRSQITTEVFVVVVASLAGALGGLAYFGVERLETA